MRTESTVLLVDDDPAHIKLYSLILERAGHQPMGLLVDRAEIELPSGEVDLILLDYRLGIASSIDLAKKLNVRFPSTPIVVLSDLQWMPKDIAPFATSFVRKGEPEQLLATIRSTLSPDDSGGSES